MPYPSDMLYPRQPGEARIQAVNPAEDPFGQTQRRRGTRAALEALQQPSDENVWKARIKGFLGGAGKTVYDFLAGGDEDLVDPTIGLAPAASIGQKPMKAIAEQAYEAVQGIPGLWSRLTQAATQLPDVLPASKVRPSLQALGAPKEEMAFRGVPELLEERISPEMQKTQEALDKAIAAGYPTEHTGLLHDILTRQAKEARIPERPIRREEVLEHLQERPLRLKVDEVRTNPNLAAAEAEMDALRAEFDDRYGHNWSLQDWGYGSPVPSPEDIARYRGIEDRLQAFNSEPRPTYAPHVVPGPQRNYSENLVKQVGGEFPGSHFNEEPNIIGWTRTAEREIPAMGGLGEQIETLQSDVHQWGPRFGYTLEELTASQDKLADFIREVEGQYGRWGGIGAPPPEIERQYWKALSDFDKIEAILTQPGSLANAGWKDSWANLLLKQRLLKAADNPDISWIGWPDAFEQSRRWGKTAGFDPGMVHAYENRYPSVLAKTMKPYGGKIEPYSIPYPEEWPLPAVRGPRPSEAIASPSLLNTVGIEHSGGMTPVASTFPPGSKISQLELSDELLDQIKRGRIPPLAFGRGMRLTPEMKANIKRYGFPAMAALLAVSHEQGQE